MKSFNANFAMHKERRVWMALLVSLAVALLPGCTTAYMSLPEPDNFQPAAAPPPPSPRAQVVEITRGLIGIPYVFGGQRPRTGLDCSGLTRYVYQRMGYKIPMGSRAQFEQLQPRKFPQPGDLVFFSIEKDSVDHVGIYVGNFKFIHAPATGYTVMYDDIRNTYWFRSFAGVRSVLPEHDPRPALTRTPEASA